MALDIGGNLFNQRDVRESVETISNKVKANPTSNFSDATTTGNFSTVTGSSVSISGLASNKTYTLVVMAGVTCQKSGSTTAQVRAVINGTNMGTHQIAIHTNTPQMSMSIIETRTGQTGATSYTALLEHNTSIATLTTAGSITMLAIEE